GVEVGQVHQLTGHVVDHLAALRQIVQDHIQLIVRQILVRLVEDQQGAVLRDAAVGEQVHPLHGHVEPREPLLHADGDGGLVVACGLVHHPGHAGEHAVDGGGQQALPVEVRLRIGAVIVIRHHIIPDYVADVKGLLPAGGLAGDHDGIRPHTVLGQGGGIDRGVGVFQGQVVAEIC
ncbi:Phage tail protein, partial [Dysosmobacter welbionis]